MTTLSLQAEEPLFRPDWAIDHVDEIAAQLLQHVRLTAIAVGLGLLISFPLAVLAHRNRWLLGPVGGFAGFLYTIPSLALFALLVPYTGLSTTTAEIGLVSYTLLILIRNTVSGFDGVSPEVKESAVAMGLSRREVFWSVELPMALPVVIAGIRIATVTTIGLVTVTSLIGQGGVGYFILLGLQRFFTTPILIGAVLSVALAVIADVGLQLIQRWLTPWAKVRSV